MTYYVYALIDPRNNKPFYIGKGKGSRIDAHEKEAAKGVYSRKCKRIREIQDDGESVVKLKLSHHKQEQDAYDAEAQEIERIGLDNLTNVVPGGGGVYPVGDCRTKLTLSDMDEVAPRLARFFRILACGHRFYVLEHDLTEPILAFCKALARDVGFDNFRSVMSRNGIEFQ